MVELAILAPMFLALLAGLLIAMRLVHGTAVVDAAAADAARQASIARTASQARQQAAASALATLHDRGLHCTPSVRLDLVGFSRPAGQPAVVAAHVTCAIRLGDLAFPGMPGTRTVTRTHRSPLDPYRGR